MASQGQIKSSSKFKSNTIADNSDQAYEDRRKITQLREQIRKDLKQSQTARIKNSSLLKGMSEEQRGLLNIDEVIDMNREQDQIFRVKRIKLKNSAKQDQAQLIFNDVDSRFDEGFPVTMRQTEQFFLDCGYELSKVQLNEIFMEMEAGRKFQRVKFEKWVNTNLNFIMHKIPRSKLDLSYEIQTDKRRNNKSMFNNKIGRTSLVEDSPQNLNQDLQVNQRSPTKVSFVPTSNSQLKNYLKQFNHKHLESQREVKKLKLKEEEQRIKAFKSQPQPEVKIPPTKLNKYHKFLAINETEEIEESGNSQKFSKQESSGVETTSMSIINPLVSFFHKSKISFHKPGALLEPIEENPDKLDVPFERVMYCSTQNLMNQSIRSVGRAQTKMEEIEQLMIIQAENDVSEQGEVDLTKMRLTNKAGGKFRETMNTTFYTQTDSVLEDAPPSKHNRGKSYGTKLTFINKNKPGQMKEINFSIAPKGPNKLHLDIEKMFQNKIKTQSRQSSLNLHKSQNIEFMLNMINSTRNGTKLLSKAFDKVSFLTVDDSASLAKQYQAQVKQRLRTKMIEEEKLRNTNVEYMAINLPSALDMHRFSKCMKKDPIYESSNGCRVVTKLRTRRDLERVEYLINNKLSPN